jgi:hypothetical protein
MAYSVPEFSKSASCHQSRAGKAMSGKTWGCKRLIPYPHGLWFRLWISVWISLQNGASYGLAADALKTGIEMDRSVSAALGPARWSFERLRAFLPPRHHACQAIADVAI